MGMIEPLNLWEKTSKWSTLCRSCESVTGKLTVTAIPGCQLDYIWNELQSRNGGHTCDPDLEAGRHRLLTWILTWFWSRSWGIVAKKFLDAGKVVHTFNPRRQRQADLWVQGQPGTEQVPSRESLSLGMVIYSFNPWSWEADMWISVNWNQLGLQSEILFTSKQTRLWVCLEGMDGSKVAASVSS